MRRFGKETENGFSLIELIVAIVVLGILAAVAMQSMTESIEDMRHIVTEREMEVLADGIVGRFEVSQGVTRSDYGFVGDIGSFPPNLQALYENPGGWANWAGPYLPASFLNDSVDFKLDEWGQPYNYSGGLIITSTGSGSNIVKKIAENQADYLLNSFGGTITDGADSLPGVVYPDSIEISVTIPNGSGGYLTKYYMPDANGGFLLDSLPVGTHPLIIIYKPTADSLVRFVVVTPRNNNSKTYRFAAAYFTP